MEAFAGEMNAKLILSIFEAGKLLKAKARKMTFGIAPNDLLKTRELSRFCGKWLLVCENARDSCKSPAHQCRLDGDLCYDFAFAKEEFYACLIPTDRS
jgi:hypothetical protein